MNKFAEMAMVEFGITKRNAMVWKLIREVITEGRDIETLHTMIQERGENKIFHCLCTLRKIKMAIAA